MLEIGVMQGRLTPSLNRGIQFFLSDRAEWEREFWLARDLGLSAIEWVCDPQTPLFDEATQEAVRSVITQTGVSVRNMDLHETLTKGDIAHISDALFETICKSIAAVKGGTVEVPLVEASSLLSKEAYSARVAALQRLISIAQICGVSVAVETDLPPQKFAELLLEVPTVGVVYDCGNSAGLGYDMRQELTAYGSRITNVHIKDKPLGGSTVPLGQGSVNFKDMFVQLKSLGYAGAVTLQVARGEDGREAETISDYIQFIKDAYESI